MENKTSKELTQIIILLKELNKKYPKDGVARHITVATTDYQNLWLLSDKELLFALEKYKLELELNIASQAEGMFDVNLEENWIQD